MKDSKIIAKFLKNEVKELCWEQSDCVHRFDDEPNDYIGAAAIGFIISWIEKKIDILSQPDIGEGFKDSKKGEK